MHSYNLTGISSCKCRYALVVHWDGILYAFTSADVLIFRSVISTCREYICSLFKAIFTWISSISWCIKIYIYTHTYTANQLSLHGFPCNSKKVYSWRFFQCSISMLTRIWGHSPEEYGTDDNSVIFLEENIQQKLWNLCLKIIYYSSSICVTLTRFSFLSVMLMKIPRNMYPPYILPVIKHFLVS